MHEMKCAPEPASSGRADGDNRNAPFGTDGSDRQYRKRNLSAAVITADHPDAANVARLVPDNAQIKKLGNAIAGYYKPARSAFAFRSRRAHEIESLARYRFPAEHGVLPLPEDGVNFTIALVAHAAPHEARAALIRWGVEMTPVIERILRDPQSWRCKFKAETLGALLALTEEERTMLGITTFRAAGQTAADQDDARRLRDRDRKRATRARQACGTVKPISAAKLKPWERAGMSRSKWYASGLNKPEAGNLAGWTTCVRSKVREEGIASDENSPDPARNLTTRELILAALDAPRSIRDLEEMTGIEKAIISPWLTRLKEAGQVQNVRRGIWGKTEVARAPRRASGNAKAEPSVRRAGTAPTIAIRPLAADSDAERTALPASRSKPDAGRGPAPFSEAASALRRAVWAVGGSYRARVRQGTSSPRGYGSAAPENSQVYGCSND